MDDYTDKPFLFISYANADRIQVSADVGRLRRLGINVWIDEKMSRYAGQPWDKVVRHIMAKPNCKGILLFVSRFSLASSAVQRELEISRSDYIKGMHWGHSLPIIQIQVQKYGLISEYCHEISEEYGNARCNSDLPEVGEVQPSEIVVDIHGKYLSNDSELHINLFDGNKNGYDALMERFKELQVVGRSNITYAVISDNVDSLLTDGKAIIKKMDQEEDSERYMEYWGMAVEKMEKAAMNHSNRAYLYLGRLYESRDDQLYSDFKTAQSCFIRAIDCGIDEALLDMCILLCNIREYKLAKKYAEKVKTKKFWEKEPFLSRYKKVLKIISKNVAH